MKWLWLLVLATPAFAQGPTITPADAAPLFATSQQFLPPVEYDTWWDELVAACECAPATNLADLIWRETPADSFLCPGVTDQGCTGQWLASGDVFLARGYWTVQRAVQHEMLHAILGRGDHPIIFRILDLGEQ